jgi:hypothetical protein
MPDGGIQIIAQARAYASFDAWSLQALHTRSPTSAPPSDPNAPPRNPWLTTFERAPETAFGDLFTGHAHIAPLNRLDAPEAANTLFGNLAPNDPARLSLGWAILGWLEKRRQEIPPSDDPGRRRWIREVRDAFDIVALLQVSEAAIAMRRGFASWNAWVADVVAAPSRDARAGYWSMLAQTQPLIRAAGSAIDPFGLASHWLWICENAGGSLPDHYLGIGLLGLRRLPVIGICSELPWLTGLAWWADARRPSRDAFRTQWLALKFLYPRTPAHWRELIARVLLDPRFQRKGIAAPAWWDVDPDFQ